MLITADENENNDRKGQMPEFQTRTTAPNQEVTFIE
jgi:hypothetical protein